MNQICSDGYVTKLKISTTLMFYKVYNLLDIQTQSHGDSINNCFYLYLLDAQTIVCCQ